MKLTHYEIQVVAKNIVNGTIADLFQEFPKVRNAIDGLTRKQWVAKLDELAEEVAETLIDRFGTLD
jgi:hypothetical protein